MAAIQAAVSVHAAKRVEAVVAWPQLDRVELAENDIGRFMPANAK